MPMCPEPAEVHGSGVRVTGSLSRPSWVLTLHLPLKPRSRPMLPAKPMRDLPGRVGWTCAAAFVRRACTDRDSTDRRSLSENYLSFVVIGMFSADVLSIRRRFLLVSLGARTT